jgi:hypothetical protein
MQYRRSNRAECENDQTGKQRTPPAIAVADGPGRQQQAGQRQGVSIHDPGQLRLRRRSGHREVSERGVQRCHRRNDQRDAHAGDRQRPGSRSAATADAYRISTLVRGTRVSTI